jgi:plastocyanin
MHRTRFVQMLLACKEGTETTPSSRGVTRDFVYGVGVGAPLVLIVVLTIMMGLVVNRSINVEIQAQTSLVAREYDVNLKLTQAIEASAERLAAMEDQLEDMRESNAGCHAHVEALEEENERAAAEAGEATEREAAVQHRLNAVEALLGTPARVHDDSTQRLVPAPTLSTTTSKRSLQEQDGEEGCLSTSEMSRLAVRTAFSVNENHATLAAAMDGKADSLAAEAAEAGRLANGCTASLTDPATTCTPPEDGLVVTGCAVSSGGGTCTVVAHTCATSPSACPLTTELSSLSSAIDGKADASAVDALGVQLADKVDTSTMTDELADKADTSTMASLLADKADETSIAALQSELDQKADASAVQALGSIVVEDMPCLCAACADFPVGAVLCVPFGSTSPCDCIDSSGSTNPIRQTYPMTQSDPKCCRSEWLPALTLTQARTSSPQEYDQDDVLVKVGGEVTFVMMGFENVEQVYDFVDFLPVTGGIRSGDPANGVTFTHTFDTPGVYFLRSQVHETLQAKVTVMDCVDCIVVAGYDGATLPTLSQALSSRAAGEFALTVSDSGLAQVMTFLTVYQDQTLALTGATLSTGQLAKLDATITLMNGAGLVVDGTYISGGVSMGQQATLQDNTGHVVATTSGLALPMVVPTAAIVSAAIVAVDESTDTVTLSEVDTSIGVGCDPPAPSRLLYNHLCSRSLA